MKHFPLRLITVKKKKRPIYQNDLWLRFIRTLEFFVQIQVFDTESCNFLKRFKNIKATFDIKI